MAINESHKGQVMTKIAHRFPHLLSSLNTIMENFLISKLNKINTIIVNRSNKNSCGIKVIFLIKNTK